MQVFKYWHKLDQPAEGPDGHEWNLVAWGGSPISEADAREKAAEKLQRWLAKLARGETLSDYEYQSRDLREELVLDIPGHSGEPLGAITRNRYGALVLNTASVLIADLDAEQPSLMTKLLGLFGRKTQDKDFRTSRVRQFVEANPGFHAVVYETHSGLRAFFTHEGFDPAGDPSRNILTALGSDRLYQKLCVAQNCYRARLTPKPWRCLASRPPNRFPRTTDGERRLFDDWLKDYEQNAAGYTVCRLLESFGSGRVTENARTLLAVHDKIAVQSGRDLLA